MVRTVVPRKPRRAARGSAAAPGAAPAAEAGESEDTFLAKLVKYVPAEVLAFFLPIVIAADNTAGDWGIWLVFGIGVVATPAYLLLHALRLPESQRPSAKPRVHMYVLAVPAFVAWALVTAAPLRDVVGIGADLAGFIVALAAFVVPALDELLDPLELAVARRHPKLVPGL